GVFIIQVTAAQRWQDQRGLAVDDVRAVRLGGNVDGQSGALEPFLHQGRVRVGQSEVAAQGDEDVNFDFGRGTHRFGGVVAVLARSGDAEFFIEALQEVFAWFFPDTEGAVTLDVGVATNRADTSTGFAEVALHEQHIHDLFDRVHGVRLLGDAQSPAHDGRFRS